MPHRLKSPFTRQRIGRRGACLLIFGFISFCIGGALFVQPHDQAGRPRTIPLLEKIAPPEVWGGSWVVLGLVAMGCAFFGWRAQAKGYLIAYTLPLIWGAAYFASWALGWLITGWIAGIVYLGYSLLVIVIAGWEESPVLMPVLAQEDEAQDE